MKSLGDIILVQNTLATFAICWREPCRILVVEAFLGGDFGPQNRRLWPARPETLILSRRLRPENPASQTRFSPEWCKPL
jgi:hypothetical protein